MSLLERLIARIAARGPMTVADYMDACLHDPQDGYYAVRPALGEGGDFLTAPHVSQMFGELIGLWAAETWARMGRPARVSLVELGPGDGTLMSDMLRAARIAPGFSEAAEVWLIETSAPLRALQADRLGDRPRWAAGLQRFPEMRRSSWSPTSSSTACRSARRSAPRRAGGSGWWGWMSGAGCDLRSEKPCTPAPFFPCGRRWPASAGRMRNRRPLRLSSSHRRSGRSVGRSRGCWREATGAGLFIDYGRSAAGDGDTLQALRGHVKEGPLETPERRI